MVTSGLGPVDRQIMLLQQSKVQQQVVLRPRGTKVEPMLPLARADRLCRLRCSCRRRPLKGRLDHWPEARCRCSPSVQQGSVAAGQAHRDDATGRGTSGLM